VKKPPQRSGPIAAIATFEIAAASSSASRGWRAYGARGGHRPGHWRHHRAARPGSARALRIVRPWADAGCVCHAGLCSRHHRRQDGAPNDMALTASAKTTRTMVSKTNARSISVLPSRSPPHLRCLPRSHSASTGHQFFGSGLGALERGAATAADVRINRSAKKRPRIRAQGRG